MRNSGNPKGIKIINNLLRQNIFWIAKAIEKYLWLASNSLSLFLERKELIEHP